ncbi:hypothetical protein BY996DRAFT_8687263 [Phakopsora pachyrhizi]|nr:hypothetical protein BY996DRAFT_8687263 [Phakopsora pachyrhizi]
MDGYKLCERFPYLSLFRIIEYFGLHNGIEIVLVGLRLMIGYSTVTVMKSLSSTSTSEVDRMDDQQLEVERIGLLDGTDVFINRRLNSLEHRLIILSFFLLCVGSIGFGLFTGELNQIGRGSTDGSDGGGGNGPRVTKTVTVPASLPTGSPSTPHDDKNVCTSDNCVDVSGEIRKTIDWSFDPCKDFERFTTINNRLNSIDETSLEIDQTIRKTLSLQKSPISGSDQSNTGTLRTLQKFYSICSNSQGTHGNDASASSFDRIYEIMRSVSSLLNDDRLDWQIRFTATFSKLQSYSIQPVFESSIINNHLSIKPSSPALEKLFDDEKEVRRIIDIFKGGGIYKPYDEKVIEDRVRSVKGLLESLNSINEAKNFERFRLFRVEELQSFVCGKGRRWIRCLIDFEEFYSSLSSTRLVDRVYVRGIDYFRELSRVFEETSSKTIETFFHLSIIYELIRPRNCLEELKSRFSRSVIDKIFLNSDQQKLQCKESLESLNFLVERILKYFRINNENQPNSTFKVETLNPKELKSLNQSEELSAIEKHDIDHKDGFLDVLLDLNRIRAREIFERRTFQWNLLSTKIFIKGDKVFVPFGVLRRPNIYRFSNDLPTSILFGSFGFILVEKFNQFFNSYNGHGNNDSLIYNKETRSIQSTRSCKNNLKTTFKIYKTSQNVSTSTRVAPGLMIHKEDKKLVGLNRLDSDSQVFFLSFGRLGVKCYDDQRSFERLDFDRCEDEVTLTDHFFGINSDADADDDYDDGWRFEKGFEEFKQSFNCT